MINKTRYSVIYIAYIFFICLILDNIFGYFLGNEGKHEGKYQSSDTLNHVFSKNFSTLVERHPQVGSYIFKTNSLGLKNSEISIHKGENTKRILLMGDSFVESYDTSKSIKAILLRNLKNDNYNIELINEGVGSYSPILHYFHYKYYLKRYNSDMAIICVDMTDIRDDYYYSTLVKYDSKDKNKAVGVGNNQTLKRDLTIHGMINKNPIFSKIWICGIFSKYSNIFNYVVFTPRKEMWWRHWGDKTLIKNRPIHDYISLANGVHYKSELAYKVTFNYLDLLIEELKDQNIEVVLSIYPHLQILQNRDTFYSKKMTDYAKKKNIPIHDLHQELLNQKDHDNYYLNGDMHFNYDGIALWGYHLANYINSISIF